VTKAKPFDIPKRQVWEAFKRVKANQGAAGVDGQSIEEFEVRLADNLYKLWNRLSSGSYMPPPVRRVDIPKADGGTRPLGIPTVADRIAQEVVRRYLEPLLEPLFHPDSYGYRPGRSAIDAIRSARQRCWRYDWVLDIDIKGFFDSIDWVLLLKAVRKHTDCPWVLLYIERWLKAPAMRDDGMLVPRERGTPQGGVISPLLANLFLHYAFDIWIKRGFPGVPFERYADDIICHCRSEREALTLRQVLERRFNECGLVLHPEKTKVVYCKDTNRKGGTRSCSSTSSATHSGRGWRNGGVGCMECHISRQPVPRPSRRSVRRSGDGHSRPGATKRWTTWRMFNPYIRGWINYYSHFYKSALYPTLRRIDVFLLQWARRKFKRLRQRPKGARDWLARVIRSSPDLFAHWPLLHGQGRALGAV
jgi:RNA-directed DNA polymerase